MLTDLEDEGMTGKYSALQGSKPRLKRREFNRMHGYALMKDEKLWTKAP